MMLNSLMHGMNEDEKLVFLTDVFCLTEDIRYVVSEGGSLEEEVQDESPMAISREDIAEVRRHCYREERGDEAHASECAK
jgi:hypothetical protein